MTNSNHFFLLVKISIIAFISGAISLPSFLELASPFWLLPFFSYWVIYSNGKNIFASAFILGILLDIIEGGTLGQNAVALVLSSAFILNVKKSFFCFKFNDSTSLYFFRIYNLFDYIFIGSAINSKPKF